jgi:hypothetical protein
MSQTPPTTISPLSADSAERLRRAFILGLNRDPLPLPETARAAIRAAGLEAEAPLIALALTAQSRRFERPACARPGSARPATPEAIRNAARMLRDDPRPILPAPARRRLNRLVGGLKTAVAQHVMWAALTRLNRRGLRLHPFDLPVMEPLLRTNEAVLGPAEQAFLTLTATPQSDDGEPVESLLYETISASNWRNFKKPKRLAFLRELRLTDPAAGRALVEASFKEETAVLRAELIAALEAGLSADDREFLEGLEKDRTEKVRFAALRLLCRIPGTEAHSKRIAHAVTRFERKSGTPEAPGKFVFRPLAATKTLSETMTRELFEGLSLRALAEMLEMEPDEFVAALSDSASSTLLPVLIPSVMAEGDVETLTAMASRVNPSVLMDLASLTRDSRDSFPAEARMAFAACFVRRLEEASIIHSLSLADLGAMIGGPLPVDLADAYLETAGWKRAVGLLSKEEGNWREHYDPESAFYTSLIMPSERLPQFLAAIETVRHNEARLAQDFAQFVLMLPSGDMPQATPLPGGEDGESMT